VVDTLVNNAGFGSMGEFVELDLKRELEIIDLNVKSLVELTHRFLKPMRERKQGAIINVASTAGFQAVPYMTTYAAKHCPIWSDSSATYDNKLGATYYDALKVYQLIGEYTHDPKWTTCVNQILIPWRDQYVIGNNGSVPGYWNFTTGLALHYERTLDPKSKDAVLLLAKNAAYCSETTPVEWLQTAGRSREVAYCLVARLNAQRLGAARTARFDALRDAALSHLDQWFVSKSYRAPADCTDCAGGAANGQYYLQPFMVLLTVDALLRSDLDYPDGRILPAVTYALESLWATAWVPADQAFFYENYSLDGGLTWAVVKPGAPDLNLLGAHSFYKVYQRTGNAAFATRADAIFASGVTKAYLEGSKQFNQNYTFSFEFVELRR